MPAIPNQSAVVTNLYRGAVELGTPSGYFALCCGRVYYGVAPATRCRTCEKTPESHPVASEADVTALIQRLA